MINNRIKMVRKKLNLTQTEFGNMVGLKQNTIATYEANIRTPSDAILLSISRACDISYDWLKTGEGEMFPPLSHDEQIAEFAADVINCDDESFKKRLVRALSQLTPQQWDVLEEVIDKLNDV